MYVGYLFNLIERAENDYLSDMQDEWEYNPQSIFHLKRFCHF